MKQKESSLVKRVRALRIGIWQQCNIHKYDVGGQVYPVEDKYHDGYRNCLSLVLCLFSMFVPESIPPEPPVKTVKKPKKKIK